MLDELFEQARSKMQKSVETLRRQLAKMRTGRTTTALVEDIRVDCYGEKVPLSQVASISVPESGLIVIQPWDPNLLKSIETAILVSGDDLTPSSDGRVIRITIPPLSEERRKKLVAVASKTCEEARAAIRNIRKETKNHIRSLQKERKISEDEESVALDDLQELTDEFMEEIEGIQEEKKQELLEF